MIKLNGSRFTAAMPEALKEQPEIQAIAYAVGRQIEKLCAYADGARTYAAIQSMPEQVLDLLAVELRTPAYAANYPIKVKQTLIEGSLLFYTQMGTPAAVEKLVEVIFGSGYISEWWEYGGKPHHFRVVSANITQVVEGLGAFTEILRGAKRLSSWLDSITITAQREQILYTGISVRIGRRTSVNCEIPAELDVTYMTDETGNLLADEAGNRIIDEEE